jgi:hypothetical protein
VRLVGDPLLDFDACHGIVESALIRGLAQRCARERPPSAPDDRRRRPCVIRLRLPGGAPSVDFRPRGSPVGATPRRLVMVMLIVAAMLAVGLGLAAFGLAAVLRIAHGHVLASQWSSAAPFGSNVQLWMAAGVADPRLPVVLMPPVVASSDSAENAQSADDVSLRQRSAADTEGHETAAANGEVADRMAQSATAEAPVAPPALVMAGSAAEPAAEPAVMASVDAAAPAPTSSKHEAAPAPRSKPRHAAKRVAHKPARRVVRRPAYSGNAVSSFPPMFGSRAAASPFQPTFNSRTAASPFQPMFNSR